jgi:hypothetical protein
VMDTCKNHANGTEVTFDSSHEPCPLCEAYRMMAALESEVAERDEQLGVSIAERDILQEQLAAELFRKTEKDDGVVVEYRGCSSNLDGAGHYLMVFKPVNDGGRLTFAPGTLIRMGVE